MSQELCATFSDSVVAVKGLSAGWVWPPGDM